MKHEVDLKNYTIRTDLALESIENNSIEKVKQEFETINEVKVTTTYLDEQNGKKIAKKSGIYITIEFEDVTDHDNLLNVKEIFSNKLKFILEKEHIKENDMGLIIGLGNENSTPDALGPLTIDKIIVTNPLYLYGELEEGYRRVCAISPGVTGETGIETSDFIKYMIDCVKPQFVIVIDALASGSIERVNRTIQMTDTGIAPGSGIGNKRKEVSKELYGIPVIAIGIPTVVDAITIVADTIKYMQKQYTYSKQNHNQPKNKLILSYQSNYLKAKIEENKEDNKQLLGLVGGLDDVEIKQLLFEVLTPIGYNFMVTPKEVDFVMEKLSEVIGEGINLALHKAIKD
ncbi:MAG: GPR endopeptidase [Bacilli bacterium]|nr:GPR endopeptidase [Bacilli bacterium]